MNQKNDCSSFQQLRESRVSTALSRYRMLEKGWMNLSPTTSYETLPMLFTILENNFYR